VPRLGSKTHTVHTATICRDGLKNVLLEKKKRTAGSLLLLSLLPPAGSSFCHPLRFHARALTRRNTHSLSALLMPVKSVTVPSSLSWLFNSASVITHGKVTQKAFT
jgi:hypothetical protein